MQRGRPARWAERRTSDRKAIKRGALIAGIVWLGLSAEILLANVVFPSKTDNDGIPVVISYLVLGAIGAVLGRFGGLAAHTAATLPSTIDWKRPN